ncbi:DUF4402 domain-containing protein [Novosphingobium tardum]|jgi:hypothetical protein|uniref:DUF4402 domain-containing protein n=1 Tax=Novosphingobium tardum TaxID=1538021 RepID=A0ABV8RNW0_9SPHN
MRRLLPLLHVACAALAVFAVPAAGEEAAACKLCLAATKPGSDTDERPLSLEITTGIEFSRLALTGRGEGTAAIDAQSGARRVDHGLIDLGGFALSGRGRITGAPLRSVRIILPTSVTMRTPQGEVAELSDLTTDLAAMPVLDATGTLEFSFGGRLRVDGPTGGNFRGRIPITVEYD